VSDKTQVVVIGAGIVGVACATYLRQAGKEVTLVDRLDPGDEGAASFGNAGSISWSSCIPIAVPGLLPKVPGWLLRNDSPLTIRWRYLPSLLPWLWRFVRTGSEASVTAAAAALSMLHTPALELHRDLARAAGVSDLVQDCGFLHVYRTARGDDRLTDLEWRLRVENGAQLAVLNRDELLAIEPDLSHEYVEAMHIKDQGFIANPSRLVSAYARHFAAQGGVIKRAEVSGFSRTNGRVSGVQLASGSVECDEVVIAAGPWSTHLTRMLGLNVPLNTERGYHVSVNDAGVSIRNTIMETDGKFVATPMETGLRFAGTVELASVDAPPDYRRADVILGVAKKMFPKIRPNDVSKWMGRRPSLPDGLPVIGPAPGHDNVFLAFGHAHTGMVGAPNTARIITGLVSKQPLNVDLAPFRATRF
jgi:D-amino-acid dehydrogenase